jgi:hypothetical protein
MAAKLMTVNTPIRTVASTGSAFPALRGMNVSYKKTIKNRTRRPISCFIAKNCE